MINQELGMNRISLDNHYHNLETGQFEKFEKIKPINPLRGSALVELFDGVTGKKKEEVLSENIISNGLNQQLYGMIIENLLQGGNTRASSLAAATLFGNLVLTDYTGAEDATLRRIEGSVVGWANKYTTYSGADPLRGTINQASSDFSNSAQLKFIFDWPTTAGNGTFKTLWWLPSVVTPTTSPLRLYCAPNLTSFSLANSLADFSVCCFVGNIFYFLKHSTSQIYSATKKIANANGLFTTGDTLAKDIAVDDSAPRGVDHDGTYFWVYGTQNGKMYKYNSSWVLQTSWTCAAITYFDTYYRFCCFNGKIYTYRRINATTWNLYKFANDGTLESTYNLYSASHTFFNDTMASSSSLKMCSDGERIYFILMVSTSYFDVIEFDSNGTKLKEYRADSTNARSSASMCFDEYKNLYLVDASAGRNTVFQYSTMLSPIAQNLLPVATTKTSANTMKITYQFNLDLTGL